MIIVFGSGSTLVGSKNRCGGNPLSWGWDSTQIFDWELEIRWNKISFLFDLFLATMAYWIIHSAAHDLLRFDHQFRKEIYFITTWEDFLKFTVCSSIFSDQLLRWQRTISQQCESLHIDHQLHWTENAFSVVGRRRWPPVSSLLFASSVLCRWTQGVMWQPSDDSTVSLFSPRRPSISRARPNRCLPLTERTWKTMAVSLYHIKRSPRAPAVIAISLFHPVVVLPWQLISYVRKYKRKDRRSLLQCATACV